MTENPTAPHTPQTLNSEPIYKGKVFDIRLDEIREDGIEYKREIVVHHGSAVIVPVFDDGTVALVWQYRHAAGKYLLEIPAGSLNRQILSFTKQSEKQAVFPRQVRLL